jgi:hypothetical protein
VKVIVEEGRWRFNFSGATLAFKFDEKYKESKFFHGLSHCMKAVDFIVEMEDFYLFVEVKDFSKSDELPTDAKRNTLVNDLVGKFRDSFLYRWAEKKDDKPVKFLCFVEIKDNAIISQIMDELHRKLPFRVPSAVQSRWNRPIAETCVVANYEKWNKNFPQWQVSKAK